MYKIYLKQAWALIRQERLFSSVYIVGTGLAISLGMVLSIVFYVKMASIYPEMDRDRLLTVKSAALKNEKGGTSSGPVSPRFVEECLAGVPGLEALALCCDDAASAFVQPVGSPVQIPVMKMGVNDGFWKVFSFRFLEGKPFTEADFRSGMPVAVIARSLAKRLYGEGSAVGQTLSLDFTSFRVVGVVDDVSYLMDRVFSQVWYPYTQVPDFEERVRYSEARMPDQRPLGSPESTPHAQLAQTPLHTGIGHAREADGGDEQQEQENHPITAQVSHDIRLHVRPIPEDTLPMAIRLPKKGELTFPILL